MRTVSCRVCGSKLAVDFICNVCNEPIKVICVDCGKYEEEYIHDRCRRKIT